MIVRNFDHPEAVQTTYQAHGGGVARMILDTRHLRDVMFLAGCVIPPGQTLEGHVDPMEEIYFLLAGRATMKVDDETAEIGPGDAVWIPQGSWHELTNIGEENCFLGVIAAPIREEVKAEWGID
ncbi:MAG: cupin domain-containing protein [Proteobacteria bacterium]|nr:cupin domain-containing protein [Pseudomonadota bacterium]